MLDVLDQIRAAADAGLYYPALMSTLALPDICGALSSDNGQTTRTKYKAWLVDRAGYRTEQAAQVYGFRCSLLHQGSPYPHGGHHRIAFVEPSPGRGGLHWIDTDIGGGDVVTWVSAEYFIGEIVEAAAAWFAEFETTATVQRNLRKFVRRRPEGLGGHVSGVPVVA